MGSQKIATTLRYYGVSPWEIEVMYGYLVGRFTVNQIEMEPEGGEFVSFLGIEIPIAFSDEFFQWFEYRRWEKVKAVFKEMKRRRGSRNALKIQVEFSGSPKITFVVDSDERQLFDNAVEKMDYVLELLPYHLDPEKLPGSVSEVTYRFHPGTARWRLDEALADGTTYMLKDGRWRAPT